MESFQTSVLTPGWSWAILEASTPCPLTPMSEEQLKAFKEAVKANEGLQEQLKAAADADAVVAIAKAAGFAISVEALKGAQAELSDEELEGVAGGYRGIEFRPKDFEKIPTRDTALRIQA